MTTLEKRKQEILKTLRECDGDRRLASEKLGMTLRDLERLIKVDPAFTKFKVEKTHEQRELEKRQMAQNAVVVQERRLEETFNTKTVVGTLENLMTKVTEKECTSETVNAACNCAGRITDLLRLHLELERLKLKGPRV